MDNTYESSSLKNILRTLRVSESMKVMTDAQREIAKSRVRIARIERLTSEARPQQEED